jgi:hypothetical protein
LCKNSFSGVYIRMAQKATKFRTNQPFKVNLMKKLTLLAGLITATIAGFAQPSVKLYGYSQSQLPGMVPKGSAGNGAKTEISIYFQSKSAYKVKPLALWVNGKSQAFTLTAVEIPVVQINKTIPSNQVKTILVPANGFKTTGFYGLKAKTATIPAAAKKLIGSNAVVIQYEWKGKKYYKALKKLTVLEPLANE